MEQALLDQVVAWNDELNGLHDELAQALVQDEREAAEELRTLIETLESQFRSKPHGDVILCPTEIMVPDRPAVVAQLISVQIHRASSSRQIRMNFPMKWLLGQPLLVFVARTERAGFLRALLEFKRERLPLVQWLITLQAVKGDAFAVRLDCSHSYGGQRATLQAIDWSFTPPRHSQRRPLTVHAPLVKT